METEASSSDDDKKLLTVSTMSSAGSSHNLPLVEEESAMDPSNHILIECQKCPGVRIPYDLLKKHMAWHGRTNLLLSLRNKIREFGTPPFGPTEPGCLIWMDYCLDELEKGVNEKGLGDFTNSPSFATIKYVDGLKYTIGNKFVGRQSQGEFIHLNLKPYYEKAIPEEELEIFFQLECKNGFMWISANHSDGVRRSTVIFVNGVALGCESRDRGGEIIVNETAGDESKSSSWQRKLVFGDVITMSIGNDDDNEKERVFRDFIFKPATLPTPEKVQINKDLSGVAEKVETCNKGPLDNSLIVQNILRCLPASAAKQTRLVTNVWNTEALKLLRNLMTVTVFKRPPNSKYYGDTLMQISDYAYSELGQLKFPHWKIELPEDKDASYVAFKDNEAQKKMIRDKKILDDLVWILDPAFQPQSVKSLDLSGSVASAIGLKMFEVVLCGVQNSLTTLHLKMNFCGYVDTKSLPTFPDEFPHLKSLSLSLDDMSCSDETFLKSLIIDRLLPAMKNIQTLSLKNSAFGRFFPSLIFQEISKTQVESPSNFANLSHVVVYSCHDSYARVGYRIIPQLSSIRHNSLKKLELGDLRAEPEEEFNSFLSVLESQAGSMEDLSLQFDLSRNPSYLTPWNVCINLPHSMPNLKTLSLFFYLDNDKSSVPNVRFRFGRGEGRRRIQATYYNIILGNLLHEDYKCLRIDYATCFPSLSNLTIWPIVSNKLESLETLKKPTESSWKTFLPIWAAFMETVTDDNSGEKCPIPSIQTLDVPYLLQKKTHASLVKLEEVFPNVVFPPELEAARQEPKWNYSDAEDKGNHYDSSD